MARAKTGSKTARKGKAKTRAPQGRRRWIWRGVLAVVLPVVALVALVSVVNPPTTFYIASEARRLGKVERQWTDMNRISPVMARSVVAAEDANFCLHWGFDMAAIRKAIDSGARRGASTITQQVVKNVFLWQGRSWPRKALEALLTPVVELTWSKRRILEVYLNVAEFGEGTFGVAAGAAKSFQEEPNAITPEQAALLASVLPDPKYRDAAHPDAWLRRRAADIRDGAATIEADGRARCFERR
ncbi:monofunctional biosynthetic peptidoglycan transglycosylase [Acidimangrovimonas pyrenivorans]|uniref:Biosynthetic peptidoglycan transglycosylase n=1 Tax=Acidimangrovimonas pyrenivorans TaxID=2030798 RepID=A0ABV7AC95_9RHOB